MRTARSHKTNGPQSHPTGDCGPFDAASIQRAGRRVRRQENGRDAAGSGNGTLDQAPPSQNGGTFRRASMCECEIERQLLGKLKVGAAGTQRLPQSAETEVTALAITCIDYRLVDDAVKFFDHMHMTNDYDQVSLAGASLAGGSDKFPSSNTTFWEQIDIAKQLHHIKKVIV